MREKLTKGRSREKITSGTFLEIRVPKDFARVTQQFTAHVNTWHFLSSRLRKV